MAERGLEVTATDYAPEFVAVGRARYPGLDVRLMDMTAPDLPPESFDGIYGFASFIHLPRGVADLTLARLHELLVPGGLLSLWLIESSQGIRDYTINEWAGEAQCPMLFTCYPQQEIEERLVAARYAEVQCLPVPSSEAYEDLPRLRDRGISSYQVFARRD
jgi:SAM-dependent methyltransferase